MNKPPQGDKVALLVLGMHRSGTSALTRALNLLGADLPTRLMPPVPGNNELGFWESEPLKELHEQFLRSMGADWRNVGLLDFDSLDPEVADRFKNDLLELLRADFNASPLFVLKDPRISRLLPLWLPVLRTFGAEPRIAITLRNPLEIAGSLEARDRFSVQHSLLLWLRYMLDAEKQTRGLPRCFVDYDHLLTDWRSVVDRLAAQLNLDWPRSPARAAAEIDEFLSPRQRHHVIPADALAGRDDIAQWIGKADGAFRILTRDAQDRSALRKLDRLAQTLGDADRTFGVVLKETEHALDATTRTLREAERDRDRTSDQLQKTEQHRDRIAEQLEATRLDRDRINQARREEVARLTDLSRRQDRYIREIKSRMDNLEQRAGVLEGALRRRDGQLALAQAGNRALLADLQALRRSPLGRTAGSLQRVAELPHLAALAIRLVRGGGVGLRGIRLRDLRAYRELEQSGLFQSRHYLDQYPDVAASGCDPLWHFLHHGAGEGRTPNPMFDTAWYLLQYGDVAASGVNPLLHFLHHGISEGRQPGPEFDIAWYLGRYPDVLESGVHPLVHYLETGAAEGRTPKYEPPPLPPAAARDDAPPPAPVSPGMRRLRGRAPVPDPKTAARRVLVVGHASRPPLFGAERSVLDVMRALQESGHEVHAAFPHDNPEYFEAVLDHVRSLSVFEYGWWRKGVPLDEQVTVLFMRLLRELQVEIIHVNTIMLREPLEAARRLGITTVVHVREIISHDVWLTEHIGLDVRSIIDEVNGRADYLVANSDAALNSFERSKGGCRVYNAVDTDALDIANDVIPDRIRVGLISSNIPKKGLADFVNLARLAQAQLPQLQFVMVGPVNEHINNLAELAGVKRLPDNLEITGYAATPRDAVSQVNVVVNFSNFAESFGRTVAEAMAARRPVIVYEHGALPELVRPGVDGWIIPYRRCEQALEPLRELCEEPDRISRMGEQARVRAVECFSQEAMATSLASAYQHITGDSRIADTETGPLRIAYFMWHFPVPSETFVLNELRALVGRDIDVQVFCRHSPYPDCVPDFDIQWRNVATPEQLAAALQETGRNLVHAHFTYPTVTDFVWPACEHTGIDFTFTAHAQDIFRYENQERNRIDEIARSPFCRKIIVLGRYHHAFLVERGVPPSKIMINPQLSDALDLAAMPAAAGIGTRFDRRRICAAQRLVEKKGLAYLVEAAADLKRLGVSVDIYGYGPLEEQLRQQIADSGLENVRLCGAIENRDRLLAVFSDYDLLVSPSVRAADGDMDGIPTILMEAMGTGLPVLSTRIASVPDLVRDGVNGLLCEPGDAEAIVAAVERFYAMPAGQVRAVAENAAETVRARYRPDLIVNNLLRQWRNEIIDLVIVSWRDLAELKEVICRIFRYTALPFRLIVCNNDSGADMVNYLDELAAGHANVTVIHQGFNSYVGPGTNTALGAGTARYAIYLCGKEGFVVSQGWESAMVEYMDRNPDVGLAGTLGYNPKCLTGQQYIDNHPMFQQFRNKDFAAKHADRIFRHVQGGLFIMRRAMYEAIGGFSEAVPHAHTDTEYSYYVESTGWRLGTVPEILSLYHKTRPGLLSRLDENVLALHPGSLELSGLVDRIAAGSGALCNICEWQGEAFDGNGSAICPGCGSGPAQRSVFRYLAESMLTYRGLNGLYVNPHPSLTSFWRAQFQGPIVSLEEFGNASGKDDSEVPQRLDIALVDHELHGEPATVQRLARVLQPDGVLLIPEAVGADGAPLADQVDALASGGLAVAQRVRYASTVIRFDWRTLLVCTRQAA